MLEIENLRIQDVFDIKLDLYNDQLQINRDAANSAYGAEQFRQIELMQQATLNRNRMFQEVLRVQGAQAARGESGNRSRARADLINSLGEFGRDQAEFDKTIYSAKWAHDQRMATISGQHANANYSAWTQIAISPALQLPGQGDGPTTRNAIGPAKINTQIGFGDYVGAIGQGIMTAASLNSMMHGGGTQPNVINEKGNVGTEGATSGATGGVGGSAGARTGSMSHMFPGAD